MIEFYDQFFTCGIFTTGRLHWDLMNYWPMILKLTVISAKKMTRGTL